MKTRDENGRIARTGIAVLAGAFLMLPFMLSGAQAVPTFVSTDGGGSERCFYGGGDTNLGGAVDTCADNQQSILDLTIQNLNSFDFVRLEDPADSIFTFLMDGSKTTSVRGRARYAGYNNDFGATVGADGTAPADYVKLLDAPGNNSFVSYAGNAGFVNLDDEIAGLSSGDFWKPTIDVRGAGTSFFTSLASDNPGGLDHMVTFKSTTNESSDNNINAFRYIIGFEDLSLGDQDYNDFVLEIEFSAVQTSVPEPAALALLGFGLVGLGAMRRRRHTA